MKKKYMFAALVFGLSVSTKVSAQVPSYVPTNGLVGWWPFNGNANDESGNGNNLTPNGAVQFSSDRFLVPNSAIYLTGLNQYFHKLSPNLPSGNSNRSVSVWYKNTIASDGATIFTQWDGANGTVSCNSNFSLFGAIDNAYLGVNCEDKAWNFNADINWINLVVVYENNYVKLYKNGILINDLNTASYYQFLNNLDTWNSSFIVGNPGGLTQPFPSQFYGYIDDIGFWNRALTQLEISALYSACAGNQITTQPVNSINNVGSNAQFYVNAAAGSTCQWQSNPLNLGWQNVNNNAIYSGVTSNTLTVSNTSVSNHHQPFRAIVNAGGCIDTSDVAEIIIGDTCLTTVTDTLIINTTLNLPAPNNENTILIYPNPASDHITIDNGNYIAMAGYSIKIVNNAGQQVFQNAINQQQFYVDLSSWTGNGLYFVHLIDSQNNTVTVRKVVLQ